MSFTMLFVTGAPRSGTTYVSDWITESPDAYCAHEILRSLKGKTDEQIVEYLWHCATTGTDRLIHQFWRQKDWNKPKNKGALRLLGFKEPLVWSLNPNRVPYPVGGFLEKFDTRHVVLIRHPFDVVASGKHRATNHDKWPNFSVEKHCQLWCDSVLLYKSYMQEGSKALCIKWERILLIYDEVKATFEDFLDIDLPEFYGYGLTPEYIQTLRKQVSLVEGLKGQRKRELLSGNDQEVIRSMTADLCSELGYQL